jgi:hypothetical protein
VKALTSYELWYGRDEPPPWRTNLRAGPLTALLEGADLRDVRLGGIEIVRRLYFAVRDVNWDTIAAEVTNLFVDVHAEGFAVEFDARHNQHLDFCWHGTIQGDRSGSITYAASGQALSEFPYCRIGFCLLHPPSECAGSRYRGQTPGGQIEGELSILIAPQRYENGLYYPLFDAVSSLTISQRSGVEARFDFEGDLFEMEDQRNWTDGSFKTYCTPLSLGYPHTARAGQSFTQRVSIGARGRPSGSDNATDGVYVSVGKPVHKKLPQIGLGIASHDAAISEADRVLLGRLALDHLRLDLHLSNPDAATRLKRAVEECGALGCSLELALFFTDEVDGELQRLASSLPVPVAVSRVLVFHEIEQTTPKELIQRVRDRLVARLAGVAIGGGTNLDFAELNRARVNPQDFDTVVYSINPQVHASDEISLVENLEAQRDTVTTARSFSGELPLVVSPVTLKPRFNPYAVEPEAAPSVGKMPSAVDPRQMSLFAAVWTLASIKQLAEAGATSVTYFETTGWRGIKEKDTGSENPELFLSSPGMVFPVYHVFADIAGLKQGGLIECSSTNPLRVQALALGTANSVHLLIANLRPEAERCSIDGLRGQRVAVRSLDEHTARQAMIEPLEFRAQQTWIPLAGPTLTLTLAPYSVTSIAQWEAS